MCPSNERPPTARDGEGSENAEADNLPTNNSTVVVLPRDPWAIAMHRARAIRFYRPGPIKDTAVRHWRLSVQSALGQEVTS